MEYKNWCILQGNFCVDVQTSKDFWKYKQFKIKSFNSKTNKLSLLSPDDGSCVEIIIDYKKIDSYFITNKKVEVFEKYLKSFDNSIHT
jgi:hypothetical protein